MRLFIGKISSRLARLQCYFIVYVSIDLRDSWSFYLGNDLIITDNDVQTDIQLQVDRSVRGAKWCSNDFSIRILFIITDRIDKVAA